THKDLRPPRPTSWFVTRRTLATGAGFNAKRPGNLELSVTGADNPEPMRESAWGPPRRLGDADVWRTSPGCNCRVMLVLRWWIAGCRAVGGGLTRGSFAGRRPHRDRSVRAATAGSRSSAQVGTKRCAAQPAA